MAQREGERAASFHYKAGRPPKKTSLKGIYSGVNVPRADTGGSCTWPFGAGIKPSCPTVEGPGPLRLYELCFWLRLA